MVTISEYWAYESTFVCKEGVLSLKAMYLWKKEIYHNSKFKGHFVVCDVSYIMAAFGDFCPKNFKS